MYKTPIPKNQILLSTKYDSKGIYIHERSYRSALSQETKRKWKNKASKEGDRERDYAGKGRAMGESINQSRG